MARDEALASEAFDHDRFTCAVSENLCCVVCMAVPAPDCARQCSSENQHILCTTCAQRICTLDRLGAMCPMCRCKLPHEANALQKPSRLVRNMYDELTLRCSYCDDSVSYGTIEEHERKCVFGPFCVPCCFALCDAEMPRYCLAKHLQVCPRRVVFCKSCHLPYPEADLQLHNQDTCSVPLRFRPQSRRRSHFTVNQKMVLLVASIGAVLAMVLVCVTRSKYYNRTVMGLLAGGE